MHLDAATRRLLGSFEAQRERERESLHRAYRNNQPLSRRAVAFRNLGSSRHLWAVNE